MALARARRGNRHIDYWPGFVDALSTLLMAIMFLLSVFVLAQFLLSREISGRDEVLARLNSQINELTQLLALEQTSTQDAQDSVANLQASLSAAESERSRLQQLLDRGAGADSEANARISAMTGELDAERQISQRRLNCSTSRSPRSGSRSQRWRMRWAYPRRATANPTPRSPISAAA
jgi:chemotaxis protein MotB